MKKHYQLRPTYISTVLTVEKLASYRTVSGQICARCGAEFSDARPMLYCSGRCYHASRTEHQLKAA